MDKLAIVPCTFDEANAFVAANHRHHGKVRGSKYQLAVAVADKVVGVAIIGRPVARHLQDGWTLEVTRLATDGTPHACSKLYAAAWRAAKAMGYKTLVTYTLESESGISLVAAGWKQVGNTKGQSWNRDIRPRVDKTPMQNKIRWEAA